MWRTWHGIALEFVREEGLLSFYIVRIIGPGFSDFTVVCIPNSKS